jgi:hypothetical protein
MALGSVDRGRTDAAGAGRLDSQSSLYAVLTRYQAWGVSPIWLPEEQGFAWWTVRDLTWMHWSEQTPGGSDRFRTYSLSQNTASLLIQDPGLGYTRVVTFQAPLTRRPVTPCGAAWWRRPDSNWRLPGCDPGALPTELQPHQRYSSIPPSILSSRLKRRDSNPQSGFSTLRIATPEGSSGILSADLFPAPVFPLHHAPMCLD